MDQSLILNPYLRELSFFRPPCRSNPTYLSLPRLLIRSGMVAEACCFQALFFPPSSWKSCISDRYEEKLSLFETARWNTGDGNLRSWKFDKLKRMRNGKWHLWRKDDDQNISILHTATMSLRNGWFFRLGWSIARYSQVSNNFSSIENDLHRQTDNLYK